MSELKIMKVCQKCKTKHTRLYPVYNQQEGGYDFICYSCMRKSIEKDFPDLVKPKGVRP